jgi:hypothetical protein
MDFDSAKTRRSLVRVLHGARELSNSLDGLGGGAKRMLWVCLETENGLRLVPAVETSTEKTVLRGVTLSDCTILIRDLAAAAKDASELRKNSSKQKGRPRGPENYPFNLLILGIFRAIEQEGGGKVTYERKTKGGTLVKTLKLLEPFMPPGAIPKPLPWRLLETIASQKNKKLRAAKGNSLGSV